MSFFSVATNTYVSIYRSASSLTGFKSRYKDIEHPASDKKITGFKFDQTSWKSEEEKNNGFNIPTLYDPSSLYVEGYYLSGIGDNEDLELVDIRKENFGEVSGENIVWSPEINHGYFYRGLDEGYLFSEDSISLFAEKDSVWHSTIDDTISGFNSVELILSPKPGIPILARSFIWNTDKLIYETDRNFLIKDSFEPIVSEEELLTEAGDEFYWDNISSVKDLFVLRKIDNILTAIFNKQVSELVGISINDINAATQEELNALEAVGSSKPIDNFEINLKYSPVDRTMPVQVILVDVFNIPTEYTVVTEFTEGEVNEVIIDYDLGILKFGTEAAGGLLPEGSSIKASYYKTVVIEYEPENTRDTSLFKYPDIRSLKRHKGNGFVFLKSQDQVPSSITLTADLDLISLNYYGPLYIGNSFTYLLAEVKDKDGNLLEGIKVFFEKLDGPSSIELGGNQEAIGFTNTNGLAKTILNPPRSIYESGGVTDEIIIDTGTTTMSIDNYFPPNNSNLFLFQVHTEDNILGIPKADLLTFYQDYIDEQETLTSQNSGPKLNIDISSLGSYAWISGAYSEFIKWEILHREFTGGATPTTYEEDDLLTGKKTIVSELNSGMINPHTGTTPAFGPVQPSSYEVTDAGINLTFDTELQAIGSTIKSYLIVGPSVGTFRAYVINPKNGNILYSNEIEVLMDIPLQFKGLIDIDAINSVPSGLLTNAYFWDQVNEELEIVENPESGIIPIGFRLLSPGVSLASALDGITFLDINPLTEPDDTISNSFTVVIS